MKQPKLKLGKDIVQLVAEIDDFNKQWQKAKKPSAERLEQWRHTAYIESIGASTRMAGLELSNTQIESLMAEQNHKLEAQDKPARQVAGYAQAQAFVLQAYESHALDLQLLAQLHQLVAPESAGDKEKSNAELEALLSWASTSLKQATMHPLLITAIFKLQFLAIRPYADGNGRLSRLLCSFLLLRSGYAYGAYSALEAVFEKNASYYHKALQRTQSTLEQETPDWQPWFAFFLHCLKLQKARLAPSLEHYEAVDSKEPSPLAMELLVLLSQEGELSQEQLAAMAAAEPGEVQLALSELSEAGHIRSRGEGRYSLAH